MKTVGPPYSGKLNVRWDGKGMVTDQDQASEALHMGKPADTDRSCLPSLSHSFTLDCNIYVGSRRAGQRVMESITGFITTRLKLRVNSEKSAVGRPWERKFLGFSFTWSQEPRRCIALAAVKRFKERVRELTRRTRGISREEMVRQLAVYLRGWQGYFGFCQTPSVLQSFDEWVRHRLRAAAWKQWKRGRSRFAELRRRGVGKDLAAQTAGSAHGPWRLANSPALNMALPNAYFRSLGLPTLAARG